MNSDIKCLLIDLGNVVINISPRLTEEAFSRLAKKWPPQKTVQERIENLSLNLELGKVSKAEFLFGVKDVLSDQNLEEEEIEKAWNAMLLDVPENRWRALQQVKDDFKLILLSNTNTIHVQHIETMLAGQFGVGLGDLFYRTCYSYELQLRKPDAQIFRQILLEENLEPASVLFLDDLETNILAAKKLGIFTEKIEPGRDMVTVFKEREWI